MGMKFLIILISIKASDYNGNIIEIKRDEIKFFYRGTNLPEDLIILSAKLKSITGDKNLINEKIRKYINEKRVTAKSNKDSVAALSKTQKIRKPGN